MVNDESLMLSFQRGSRAALEELFARYREPLFGFFRRRLNDTQRVEDLAPETFVGPGTERVSIGREDVTQQYINLQLGSTTRAMLKSGLRTFCASARKDSQTFSPSRRTDRSYGRRD